MNLGEVVYQKIARRTSRRAETPAALVARAQAEAGGVSQLARAIGVSRTTVQRWNKGATPTLESQELLKSVMRRSDLKASHERALRESNKLTVTGWQGDGTSYGRPSRRERTIELGRYLRPGTMGRAVEAYLRGASVYELHLIVWRGITDSAYRWMFQPPGAGALRHTTEDRVVTAAGRLAAEGQGHMRLTDLADEAALSVTDVRSAVAEMVADGRAEYVDVDGERALVLYPDYDAGGELYDPYEGEAVADNEGYEFNIMSAR